MSTVIDIRDLPQRIEEVLALAVSGREVILTDGAVARARIIPCQVAGPRRPGLHAGAIQPAADFDAPLPDDFWAGSP